ncbi:Golgi reassembly-stacking protein 1 [Haplosporangium sp. Z 11]|nr:Golgi reassembly-stacking protein 1 [Haplosporangium sp. Z 11]
MGNTTSGEEGRHRLGYHVLRVKEDSPAQRAGIRPFFDYIVAINGVRLNTEGTYLQEQMAANEDKPVMLDIYSTRQQAGRRVEMIPTRKWGDGKGGLIGCSIRFCMFDAINDVVWHILDVAHGSPAEKAGLCAHSDYVIGTPYGIMRGEGDLYDLVEDNIGEPLRLHVYNSETDHIVIIPNEDWGGEGLLGCDVGYGYLHRLPRQNVIVSGGSPRRTPSLPYPSSQEMTQGGSYVRNTMPASFQPGEQPDIIAPTPRPSQSPSWLNPGAVLEGSIQRVADTTAAEEEQEQDLPPFRFGRGERPDAEDEPESEDEFVPRARRELAAHQDSALIPSGSSGQADFGSIHTMIHQPTRSAPQAQPQAVSPTMLKQMQAIVIGGNGNNTSNQPSALHSHTQIQNTSQQGYSQQQQQQQHPPVSKPMSPPRTKAAANVNTGDIPFGTGNNSEFSSTIGLQQQQQYRQ